jgi:hypothetical protein
MKIEMITISKGEYESLQQMVYQLEELVHQLQEEILLLKQGHSSKTSSTPPSQDIGGSNSNSLCKTNGNKSGGQKGYEGHHLSMIPHPDEVINHIPEQCPQCGTSLEEVSAESIKNRNDVFFVLECLAKCRIS